MQAVWGPVSGAALKFFYVPHNGPLEALHDDQCECDRKIGGH